MNWLKSGHVKAAMLVGPLLAVVAYVAVDRSLAERPMAAATGESYRLAQQSNCRYASGACTLRNGDVEVRIRAKRMNAQEVELHVSSQPAIHSTLVSLGSSEPGTLPTRVSSEAPTVRLKLAGPAKESLRWAIGIQGSTYFAETPAVFVDRETSFPQDNFSSRP